MEASIVGSGSGERDLFFSNKTANEIKDLSRLLGTTDKQTFRSLIKLAVLDFEGKPISEDVYQSIKQQAKNPANIDVIYHNLYTLLNAALRLPEHSLKPEIFKEDLKELRLKKSECYDLLLFLCRIPEDFVEDLVNVVYGPRRTVIDNGRLKQGPHFPHLESLRWRVDVAISSSVLSKVLEPSVLMELASDKGEKHTIEIQPSKFHRLRFAVASLLKEMEDIEKRSILKMQI